jgi:hypothetical protein
MIFYRREGIGQDQELVRMRRRTFFGALWIIGAVLAALALAILSLRVGSGTLLVHADQPDAMIVINGSGTPYTPGMPIKGLRPDTYNVSVSKEGFFPQPSSQLVKLETGKTQELHFTLLPLPPEPSPPNPPAGATKPSSLKTEPQKVDPRPAGSATKDAPVRSKIEEHNPSIHTPQKSAEQSGANNAEVSRGTLRISTHPPNGKIYVDEEFAGMGSVTKTDLRLGEVVIRFGEMEGYRTPPAQKIILSPERSEASVEGVYLPLIYIAAYLDGSGRAVTLKSSLKSGYVDESGAPVPDAVAGPEVKFLEEIRTFAWEIGYAFTNRNPPGLDFLEMQFELPENWSGVKPLELRLYGCATNKKFPFAVSNRTALDIFVNDKPVKMDFQPTVQVGQFDGTGYDLIAVHQYLVTGPNRIRIQTSASGKCFYSLCKIVLL